MLQQELLKRVVGVLDQEGIGYMTTGSVVSSLQGEPRSTHDIDLVVIITPPAVTRLVQAFPPPDYYISAEAAREAIANGSMFNMISLKDGYKVDFWLLTDDPFDRSRFSRKYREPFGGFHINVSAPEDTILAKLRWSKMSGASRKQFTDALRVYEIQYSQLDHAYLDEWAGKLGLEKEFQRMKEGARAV